ncbi:unnamed protein product [Larinioides sclopetarius]|uniref:Uncharacterized protein n=1 Tax=Larinioides sclopetarius TaxID=280406 RepID=A0AAV2B3R0_9ARAC
MLPQAQKRHGDILITLFANGHLADDSVPVQKETSHLLSDIRRYLKDGISHL